MSERSPGAVVVVNRGAGGVDDAVVSSVLAAAHEHGPSEHVEDHDLHDRAAQVVARAAGRPLVLLGGDGTVHRGVQALHDAGLLGRTTVVVAPGGSGDDLAGALGLDGLPGDVVARCLAGRPVGVDLVVDDDGVCCVNVAHVGAGVATNERASGLKDRLAPLGLAALAYPAAAVVDAVRGPQVQALRVQADHAVVHDDDVALVSVANGRRFGGGAARLGEADLHDGRVAVLVATVRTPRDRVALGVALAARRVQDDDAVQVHQAEAVVVSGTPARWVVDGEPDEEPVVRRRWRVLPSAWQVLLPVDDGPAPEG